MGQPAMDVSSPTDRSNTSASMGSLLLQGWAMLADGCEHCGVGSHQRRGLVATQGQEFQDGTPGYQSSSS